MQDMMGGFFGLELPDYGNFPYAESPCCAYVSSGRAAFECLLQHLPRPDRLWIPRFICDTVLQAPQRLGIPVGRYDCTAQLEPLLPDIPAGDLILLVNYFGLTSSRLKATLSRYPGQCIIDATTALYTPPPAGAPAFYSPRKFSGVADGGIALAPFALHNLPQDTDSSSASSLHLLERLEAGAARALPACEEAEARLNAPPRLMSPLTRRLLRSIDFNHAAACRCRNYGILHRALGGINRLDLPGVPEHAPMCYPLLCGIPMLRDSLIDAGVALPLYWPEVIENTGACDTANYLARQLIPLPLDQRYEEADMQRLIDLILG